jgi:hypothetical protein
VGQDSGPHNSAILWPPIAKARLDLLTITQFPAIQILLTLSTQLKEQNPQILKGQCHDMMVVEVRQWSSRLRLN